MAVEERAKAIREVANTAWGWLGNTATDRGIAVSDDHGWFIRVGAPRWIASMIETLPGACDKYTPNYGVAMAADAIEYLLGQPEHDAAPEAFTVVAEEFAHEEPQPYSLTKEDDYANAMHVYESLASVAAIRSEHDSRPEHQEPPALSLMATIWGE